MKIRWMKHQSLLAFGIALLALNGCDEESTDIKGVACEGFSALVMRDGTICRNDGSCEGGSCEENCAKIPSLSSAFHNGICPKNYICNESEKQCRSSVLECAENVCNQAQECKNADTRCGRECLNCNTKGNASAGTCDVAEGVCTITACALTFHMAEESGQITCVKNTFELCGKHDSTVADSCKKDGIMDGICDDGECIATQCSAGHQLVGGACMADTEIACGSSTNDCTKLTGWVGGSCVGGQCVATSCAQNHCLKDGTCVHGAMNALACGIDGSKQCHDCAKDDMRCVNGSCVESSCEPGVCDTGEGEGKDRCRNDNTHCGMGCLNCNEENNATAGICDARGECVATACKPDHHLNNGKCDPDTREACGSPDINCTALNGWVSGDCNGGKCIANVCSNGYHLESGACVEDNVKVCGETKVDCTALAGWRSGTCIGGQCKAALCTDDHCVNGDNQCVSGQTKLTCGKGMACIICAENEVCSEGNCIIP